ncbi:spore germination protein [Clostridium brassicae]|uniref:Spore germination protein n=1 Tax=Clostridium brassicae TaxID=2999072 RepID=A0ABT4D8Y4_9CLOT|nr:spore germination protein [Clostridium brassicae]MCY6958751.1 spore germination protein [Clostridium brassicae]
MDELIKEDISLNVEDDVRYIKNLLKNNSDVVYREFYVYEWKAAFIYIDGMADKNLLNNFVLEPLMEKNSIIETVEEIKDKILAVSDIREVKKFPEGINAMLSGDTLMLIEGLGAAYVIATRFWPARGVGEPSGETVVRGAREGFTETIRFNTVLIRRRIRDTELKVIPKSMGKRSKTDTAIMYINDIVNQEVLNELKTRLERIEIDAILDSGYIEQMIEDNKLSPFPQIQSTERPDVVAAALYEGRIAMLVDNSPFAIIVPATLPNLLQSPDDYYQRWLNSSVVRCIRFIAIFLAVLLPALYVAVTSFHTSIIPTELAYSIAGSREGVPFPAYVEALIMDISLALLLEAIVRLPKPVGATIGIVGGLIIGQAAVSAGIVSPIMIIIVGITAITEFITPNYSLSFALRIARFMAIIASAIMGLYGIMIVVLLFLIHLIRLKSFGIPYLAPIVNPNIKDFKDMFVRLPFMFFKERPKYMNTKDKIRQK